MGIPRIYPWGGCQKDGAIDITYQTLDVDDKVNHLAVVLTLNKQEVEILKDFLMEGNEEDEVLN